MNWIPSGLTAGPRRWLTLHDFGGAVLLYWLGGFAVGGFVLDFAVNYLVLRFTLGRLGQLTWHIRDTLLGYCFGITLLGLLIDGVYAGTWMAAGFAVYRSSALGYAVMLTLVGVGLFLPTAALIGWANMAISRSRLGLSAQQSRVVGFRMGTLTAPWLILFGVLVPQWLRLL